MDRLSTVRRPRFRRGELRTWTWLRAMMEHEVHHRGRLYLMPSTTGFESPSLFGLIPEEVAERSR